MRCSIRRRRSSYEPRKFVPRVKELWYAACANDRVDLFLIRETGFDYRLSFLLLAAVARQASSTVNDNTSEQHNHLFYIQALESVADAECPWPVSREMHSTIRNVCRIARQQDNVMPRHTTRAVGARGVRDAVLCVFCYLQTSLLMRPAAPTPFLRDIPGHTALFRHRCVRLMDSLTAGLQLLAGNSRRITKKDNAPFNGYRWSDCYTWREHYEAQGDVVATMLHPGWVFNPAWATSDAVALARQMYESQDFSPMPILADMLQDAGCNETALLLLMRQSVAFYRGCRIVDELLGKRKLSPRGNDG